MAGNMKRPAVLTDVYAVGTPHSRVATISRVGGWQLCRSLSSSVSIPTSCKLHHALSGHPPPSKYTMPSIRLFRQVHLSALDDSVSYETRSRRVYVRCTSVWFEVLLS